jgi:hypothetical protein
MLSNYIKCASLLVLVLLHTSLSLAEERLTSSQLRAKGVESHSLQPINFSHDSKLVACFDRAPFELKKEGTFYRLWLFSIERDGKLGDVRSVNLPLKSLEQGEFTTDDSHFIVLGDRGTTFLSIDLSSLNVTSVMEPSWGDSGFRADPPVLWTEGGKLFATGYPYDKDRFVETRTVATVHPNASASKRFERGPDISTLEKGLERLWFAAYLSDHAAFFGQKYPQLTTLSFWNGDSVTEFDRAWKFLGFWSNAGRLLYSARRTEGAPCELSLYDTATGNKKVLHQAEDSYRYIFLSRDGSTLLTSQADSEEGRLVTLYAKESDDWTLKPIATDRNDRPRTIPAGWMRLSSDGNYMVHIEAGGLTLYSLD